MNNRDWREGGAKALGHALFYLVASMFWPVFVLLAIYWRIRRPAEQPIPMFDAERKDRRVSLVRSILEGLPKTTVDSTEGTELEQSLGEYSEQDLPIVRSLELLIEALGESRDDLDLDEAYKLVVDADRKEKEAAAEELNRLSPDGIRYSRRLTEPTYSWSVVMTKVFKKSLARIDGKVKGRLATALSEIGKDPITVRGNTIKPLTRNRKHCWRYRIGDYRLVYLADVDLRRVVLLQISPRGEVYN
ncbi:type II toxin-antitoxin system RelE/ParE family toxin [Akkermansiaceae bacterium]|nr:type II toxin-antitoxin system RelE/ParE family toxin [Akkermansiaceae bacterium]